MSVTVRSQLNSSTVLQGGADGKSSVTLAVSVNVNAADKPALLTASPRKVWVSNNGPWCPRVLQMPSWEVFTKAQSRGQSQQHPDKDPTACARASHANCERNAQSSYRDELKRERRIAHRTNICHSSSQRRRSFIWTHLGKHTYSRY